MSTLSSSSTLAQIEASYDDNASYEEDASAAKARAFVTACRLLIRQYRKKWKTAAGSEIENDIKRLQEEMAKASTWLATSGAGTAGAGVKHVDLRGFRE